jgi:hypothetical protein
MQYNNHPRLTHDFSRQFAKVACPDSDARASALPAFIALHKMKAQLRLYAALNQCLQMKPRMGLLNKPAQFGASTPSGQGATGVIIGYDEKGQLRCIASNALPKPTACKQTATMPPDLINKLSARGVAATEQLDLMHQAISIAAKDRMDWVDRVCDEGIRHRISPIFLLVIDGSEAHFYCATALIDVTATQTDLSRQWTGQTLA